MVYKTIKKLKLYLKRNFIDILLISETHFITKIYFSIPRYKLYYTNHPDGTAHEGTAILRNNRTLWTVKIRRNLHSGYIIRTEKISIWDTISHLLPTLIQSKKGTFWDILSYARTKIYSRRQLQQQTHSMGLMFKNNKEQIIVKSNPREKLLICINWNTNILVYWQKQNSASTRFLCNQWNLINIHRHTIKLRLNFGPFSNNSNIKHTSNSQKTNTTLARLKNQLGYLQTNNTRQSKFINKT